MSDAGGIFWLHSFLPFLQRFLEMTVGRSTRRRSQTLLLSRKEEGRTPARTSRLIKTIVRRRKKSLSW
jgi:hypothetical protein